jgi:hypothetical protein
MLETMRFGKHKGELVSLVPTDYLVWCVENMSIPPKAVVAELQRRAAMHGTRDALTAASAVSAVAFEQARPQRPQCKKRRKKKEKPAADRKERRAAIQRQEAAARLSRAQARPVVGADFDRLRVAFSQAGGDEEACPFDTAGEPYAGPELNYSGGRWNIVEPEFPEEYF